MGVASDACSDGCQGEPHWQRPFTHFFPEDSQSMQATPWIPQPVSELPSLQLLPPLSQHPVHIAQMTGALPASTETPPLELELLELLELEPLELDERPLLEPLELDPLLPDTPLELLPVAPLDELLATPPELLLEPPEPLLPPALASSEPTVRPESRLSSAAGPLSIGFSPPVAHAATRTAKTRTPGVL